MKKKILITINTMGRAGAERALISLLKSINHTDYEIDFLSLINRGELFAEIPEYVNILNETPQAKSVLNKEGKRFVIKTIIKGALNKGYFFAFMPYAFRNIYNQLKKRNLKLDKLFWKLIADNTPVIDKEYDVAIGYTEGASTYYVVDHVNAKKKVSFVHIDYSVAGYIKSLDERYYENLAQIFCVSDDVRENFLKVFPEHENKCRVFKNIIIPDDIINLSKTGAGFTDNFEGLRLLTVGRLHYQKGYDIAIPAFARLVKEGYDNVKWYILGEGSERKNLEKLIDEYNLKDKFILLGATPNPYPFFSECDIYVQPSRFEGWGIALAEALVLLKPAVVTNFAGAEDQIDNGKDGIIISLSEDNLTNALEQIIDDNALREKFKQNLTRKVNNYDRDIHYIYDLCDDNL